MARRGKSARIDEGELEKLAMLQCTDEEVAAWFNVSTKTIERRRKTGRFAEIMERGRAKGRISLRRTQMRLAEQGSGSVAIWLGKQLLGQVDHIDHRVEQSNVLRVITIPKIWDVINRDGSQVPRPPGVPTPPKSQPGLLAAPIDVVGTLKGNG
jgi:hypothetical protein